MDVNCSLEMLDDSFGVYSDDYHYCDGREVRAPIGGDELAQRTVKLLKRWVEHYSAHCYRDELVTLGLHLYEIAFCTPDLRSGRPFPLRDAFESTYEAFTRKKQGTSRLRLRLLLRNEARWLSTLPWEFMYMPREGEMGAGFFLAGQQTDLVLTRLVPKISENLITARGGEKLRILVVVSQPKGEDIVDDKQLITEIETLLGDQTVVERFAQPTRRSLKARVKQFSPHILHFIGHGKAGHIALIPEPRELAEAQAEIELQRASGRAAKPVEEIDWVDKQSVGGLLGESPPRLVFLHACKGAATEILTQSLEAFYDTARQLAYDTQVPAVIAMQYEISNENATRFASTFYKQIRNGKPIDEAVMEARRELGTFTQKRQEWDDRSFGTPVVYLHQKSEGPIIEPPPSELDGGRERSAQSPQTKRPCPYGDCQNGWVIPGRNFCPVCHQRLMLCPKCGEVMAEKTGFCDACGYTVVPTAHPSHAGAPRLQQDATPAPAPREPQRTSYGE